ncbi:MAG: hypothetical protein LBL87_08070 [Ruminococcus sp.]|nr:hypothetical protein [Ruminococcus sp.]
MRRKIEIIIAGLFALVYGTLMIIFSKEAAEAVRGSIEVCLTAIIPSLFAFMVLSSFIIKTGLYKALSKPFAGFSRAVLRIPPELFSVFLLSCIAGYPVGAKLLSDLEKNGAADRDTCASMQCFCYMGGPAYFCGIVSVTLFGSIKIGLLILLITLFVNFTVALLSAKSRPVPKRKPIVCNVKISVKNFLSAVTDGGAAVLIMCGIIVFFSTFTALLEELGFTGFFGLWCSKLFGLSAADGGALVRSIVEINNVRTFTPGNIRLLPLITALLTFGGFCVILQMYQFAQNYIKTGLFFVYRGFAAVLSYTLMSAALHFFPQIAAVSADINALPAVTKNSFMPSICLLIMLILLFCTDLPTLNPRSRRLQTGFSDKRNN